MKFKAGYVGIIGQANAGKSTLLNLLVGEKVAIVTPKPQTTRQRVVGLLTTPAAQLCFVDSPGIVHAEKGLNQFLEREYKDVIGQSDVLIALLQIDERKIESLEAVVKTVSSSGKPWIAVINKDDLPLRHRIPIIHGLLKDFPNQPVVVGSALERPEELRAELLPKLIEHLPLSPGPLYDAEQYTTQNLRDMAGEIVREKAFIHLHQEIPFGLAVRLRTFDETSSKVVKIAAELLVNKENHRPMVIGSGGQRLKAIGTEARLEIEKLIGQKVYLELHVVVKPQWSQNPRLMKELGYGV